MPKHWIGSATDLTAWLHQQGATLAELDQARLDQWLVGGRWRGRDVRVFIAWLERQLVT